MTVRVIQKGRMDNVLFTGRCLMVVVAVIHVLGERTSRSPAPFPLPSQVRVRSQLPAEAVGGQHRGNWKETWLSASQVKHRSTKVHRPHGPCSSVLCSELLITPLSWLAMPPPIPSLFIPGWPHELSPVYHLSGKTLCLLLHLCCGRGMTLIYQEKEN